MLVVSLLCHSEAAKAWLIFSSGYLCERIRSHGQRVFVRTRKSSARGITHGSYWITPMIFLEPQTSSEGSSSIVGPPPRQPSPRALRASGLAPPPRRLRPPGPCPPGPPAPDHKGIGQHRGRRH